MLRSNYTLNKSLLLVNHDLIIPIIEQGIQMETLELQLTDNESEVKQKSERIREANLLLSFLHFARLSNGS